MRALLFVQTGDGRPKCVKQFGARVAWARQYFAKIAFGAPGQPTRGWLVECENAEDGREAIAMGECGASCQCGDCGELGDQCKCRGRILASGGKGDRDA